MRKFTFALLALVVALGGAEAVLRLVGYQGKPAATDFRFRVEGELLGAPDPVLFWRRPDLKPNFSGRAARVICLADSVTVMDRGQGWPELLPEALKASGYEKPVEIMNAGVPGYSTWQGLRYLETELLAAKPNLITIEYIWNDRRESAGGVPDHRIELPSARLFAWQGRLAHSRLYRLLRSSLIETPRPNGTSRVPIPEYHRNIRRMVKLAQERGIRVILLTAPYLDRPNDWPELQDAYNGVTRRLAGETHSSLVDLTAEFRDRPDLFLSPDTDQCHFNAQGAALMAKAVAETVVRDKLLP
ncbi:MAG: hypothetical protein GX444_07025 [Myxococcales bacterium]|nr:hypothetical protein [Myxococcales bacterium]